MEPVKITNTQNWSSIDIFLFSNGQQYSPPRKYHLRSEELQYWGTTISYLGRTHYGSGHSSIELYTLDGTKVNGPLELINGVAYVAVEPPDSFINTGYEDYLLKASRSREKREAQKTYNNQISNPDMRCCKNPTEQNTTDDINVIYVPEKIPETVSLREKKNTISPPVTTRPTKLQQRLQRKSMTCSKQIQKKKSFDTHTAALKRIYAETDKVFPCPNKQLQKKNECANRKSSIIDDNQMIRKQELSSCKRRSSVKNGGESGKIHQLYPFDGSNLNAGVNKEHPDVNLCKNKKTELSSIQNDPELYPKIDEVEQPHGQNNLVDGNARNAIPMQGKYVNGSEIDHDQTFEIHSTNKLSEINEHGSSNISQKNDFLKHDVQQISENHIPKSDNHIGKKSYNNENKLNVSSVSEKQVSDEYVAHMNKGGILHLKLKIKLKDCKTIVNRDKNLAISNSLSNLLKTEKTSQVDININISGELLKSNDEQCTQNKSLQSLLNKLYNEGIDGINSKNSRIIILQCACRNYSDNHKYCMCENAFDGCEIEDRKCETTFLNQNLNEALTSCACQNESSRVSKDENPLEQSPGKTFQSPNVASVNRPSVSNANESRVKYLAQKFEVTMPTRNKNNITPKNESVELTSLEGGTVYEFRDENYNTRRTSDKSTQTDWCNILLEARLQEDNNYSFHLPSLYILKQCNII